LTIREAVWLTDNTYKYEDLVRMMGEIISALEGKIRVSLESGWSISPLGLLLKSGCCNWHFSLSKMLGFCASSQSVVYTVHITEDADTKPSAFP